LFHFILFSFLTGNKIDREDREIPTHVGEEFAQRHSMYYLETSAKEAENVEKLFMEIAAELMEVNTTCIIEVCTMNKGACSGAVG
jgi:GTPase SAR1 family protein